MKQFRLIDNALGWLAFLIAAFVYCSTIEPTASFWDCPEFITTGYRLEIGHPPGAPFFMLTANLFSQFTSDPTQVARMVNTMSALLSATCILFLFWTITHLTRRLLISNWDEMTLPKMIAIEASGNEVCIDLWMEKAAAEGSPVAMHYLGKMAAVRNASPELRYLRGAQREAHRRAQAPQGARRHAGEEDPRGRFQSFCRGAVLFLLFRKSRFPAGALPAGNGGCCGQIRCFQIQIS